jgi:hypothetical protein
MKHLLVLLVFGAFLAAPALAQDQNPPPGAPPPGPPGGHHGILSDTEKQELHAAHDAAYQADSSLATEESDLKAKMEAFHEKVNAAMVKADPKVAPILAKLDAAHHHGGGPQGPPPPPPNQ